MLLLFRFINIKIFILIYLYAIPIKAQSSVDFLNSIFNKVYTKLSFYKSASYNLKITTLEANNVISTYTAEVIEIHNNDSNYVMYKLNNKQIFFSYSNILGIQRFWLGKVEDLPEVYSKDNDNKILNTAISYTNLNINPLWFNVPVSYKFDQGFLVVQAYNKNLFTYFPKIEIFVNKEDIPIRVLYYNKISNFPALEVLTTEYKNEGVGYFIYKAEYKDNFSKKVTVIEKEKVRFNIPLPDWFENVEALINNNITNYYSDFMVGITDKKNISDLEEYFNKFSFADDNTVINPTGNALTTDVPNVSDKKHNSNNLLLQELDALNEDSLLFQESTLGSKNKIEDSNSIIGEDKVVSKIKGKKIDSNKLKDIHSLQEKTRVLNKTKDVKLKNQVKKNIVNKEKESSSKIPVINNKNKKTNSNDIKNESTVKSEDSLNLENSTVKRFTDNERDFENNTVKNVPLKKKEKQKNILNNLF